MARSDGRGRRRTPPGLVRWHRRIGLAAAAFFVFLVVTGSLLGHADRLGLTGTHVEWSPLLALYGRSPPSEPLAFRAGDGWVTWLEGSLFVDGAAVGGELGRPLGAAAVGPAIAVATGDSVILLDRDGAVIERLSGPALPGAPRALGRTEQERLALRTARGRFLADRSLVQWEPAPADATIAWSAPAEMPDAVQAAVIEAWRGPGPTWDRVLADVHSGRILGPWGPWLVDLLGVTLLALAATGLIQWARGR